MKKIIIILICFLGFLACNDIASEKDWIGEYTLQVEVQMTCSDGTTITDERLRNLPMRIYKKKGHMYVQSCFGQPFIGDGEAPDAIRASQRLPQAKDSKGNIVSFGEPMTFVSDGFVFTIRSGVVFFPLPVKVVSYSSTLLKLQQGETFEIIIVSLDGSYITDATFCYCYEPIYREQDHLSWEVEMDLESPSPLILNSETIEAVTKVSYHCIAHKK